MSEVKKDYRIFSSKNGDWYVAAYKQGDTPVIISEGHSRGEAYRAIAEDLLGTPVETREVDMSDGLWAPELSHWRKPRKK